MTTRTILVSLQGQSNASNNLRLVDSEGHDGVNDITTNVDPDDTVIWEVNPNPPAGSIAIRSINNVYKKTDVPDNYTLLTSNPTRNAAGNYQGTVVSATSSPGSGKKESYAIAYTKTDGTSGTDDPKLNMN